MANTVFVISAVDIITTMFTNEMVQRRLGMLVANMSTSSDLGNDTTLIATEILPKVLKISLASALAPVA